MKKIALLITLFIFASVIQAQEEEEEPAEDPAIQEALATGSASGPSSFLIGIGIMNSLSVSGTDQTDPAKNRPYLPQISLLYDMDGLSFGLEFLMDASLSVQATGALSLDKILDSDLHFLGSSYSGVVKIGSDFIFVVGFGTNAFDVSQNLSQKTAKAAANSYLVTQTLTANSGSQWFLGGEMPVGEEARIFVDYRNMTIPVDAKTSITPLGTATTITGTKSFDLTFTLMSVGASYYF